MREKRDRDS